jgi:RNA polymerase sigma-70 factor (ECF subfamily)
MDASSPQQPPGVAELAQWIAAAREGSREALGRLLEACRQQLLQLAERELDSDLRAKASASDLVQQSFLEAHQGFGQFRGRTEAELLAWLRRILLHNVVNFSRQYHGTEMRAAGREVPLDQAAGQTLPAGQLSPSGQAMANEQAEAVRRALQRLPQEYHAVLLMRQCDRRSFEEIGKTLGRSAGAARKLWARALERLKQEVEATDGDA